MKGLKGIIKVASFAAVVLCSLFIVQWYQLKCMAHLQEAVYVVDSSEVAKNLIKGEEPKSRSYVLKRVEADEPVYKRGFDLYVGQGKDKIVKDFPFFANDGNAVMIMAEEPVLLDTQFQEAKTFQGMYVSDGLTFNYDKTQADEDSFLFLKLDNGLFMNTQNILFEYPGGTSQVRMNSIFYLGLDGARYYAVQGGNTLQYAALPTTKLTKATIGGETYSYEQLLELLGVTKKSGKTAPKDSKETEPETLAEADREREEASGEGLLDTGDTENAGEGEAETEESGEGNGESAKGAKAQAGAAAAAQASREAARAARENRRRAAGEGSGEEGFGRRDSGEGFGDGDFGFGDSGEDFGDGDFGWSDSNNGSGDGGFGWGDSNEGSGGGGSGWGDSDNGSGDNGSGDNGSGDNGTGDNGSGNGGSGNGGSGSGGSGSGGSGSGGSGSGSSGSGGSGSGGSGSGSSGSGSSGSGGSGSGGSGSGSSGSGGSGSGSSGSGGSGSGGSGTGGSEGSTESGGAAEPGESGSGDYVEPTEGESESGSGGSGTGGSGVQVPFKYPSAFLDAFKTDVYNVTTRLEIEDPAFVAKRVVIELYWQPENDDGSPKPDSDKQSDYQLMYRKTFRGDGDVVIDNLPPNTMMYARGLLYYMKDGKTENLVFYEGFENRFKTLSLDYVDDLYVEFKPSAADMTYLPNQMQLFELAVSGPNANVVNKIGKIRLNLVATGGSSKGNTYTLQMGLADAKRNYFYKKDAASRPVWVSDTKQIYLPSDTEFAYTIDLLDPFGNTFTRVVEGYMDNTVDQEENRSLNCCEKLENYYTPTGTTRTARVVPKVALNQKGWTDGKKNIDRVAYELAFTDPDKAIAGYEDTYYLEVFREGDPTKAPIEFTDKDGNKVKRLAIEKDNLRGDLARYEIQGLTAGHIYQVNIYGDYNLNDNQPTYVNQLIGSQRFSTISMGSYGRVSYNLVNSHVKTNVWPNGDIKDEPSPYESATAQKITMSIDYTQTSWELVDLYMDHVDFDVLDTKTKKYILKGTLNRKTMESDALMITGSGTGDRQQFSVDKEVFFGDSMSSMKGGYLPEVYVEAEDFAGEKTMWEVFATPASKARLVFYWEDGTLESNNGYQFNTATYAAQGGEIHDITGRSAFYKRLSFSTLKKMPYVDYDDVILVSDYIKLYHLSFHDEDHAITGGNASASLVGVETTRLSLDYEAKPGGYVDELVYKNLTEGKNYQISISGDVIRRDTAGEFVMRSEALMDPFLFRAGDGLSGRLIFESINYPLQNKSGDEDAVELKNEYSLYNASGFATGLMGTDGTIADTGNPSTGNWMTSPMISVNPGDVYYITGQRSNPANESYVCFYGADGRVANVNTHSWKKTGSAPSAPSHTVNRFTINGGAAAIVVPEGVSYLRFGMAGNTNSIPTYATASCFYLTKAGAESKMGSLEPVYSVKPGERYAIAQGYANYTVSFRDGSNNEIEKLNWGYRMGASFDVPAKAVSMVITKATSASYTELKEAILYKLEVDKLDWLESKDLSRFANSVTLTVSDPMNNLILGDENRVYLDVKENGVLLEGDADPIPAEIRDQLYLKRTESGELTVTENLTTLVSFIGEANRTFDLRLYVKYRGEEITLDEINFKTNRVMEVIHDRTELAKLMRYPSGDFLVVNDIYLRDNETFYFSETVPFEGTLDFQGYTMYAKHTQGAYGIHTIGSSGTVKNLVLDYVLDATANKRPMSWCRGLAVRNRGIIQNVVVNFNLGQGTYRKEYCSGLVEVNNGVIENFNVNFSANSTNYVGRYFGGLVRANEGEVRNGYVYCPGSINVTTGVYGGSKTITNEYTGLVQSHGGGVLENVYVVGNLAVERYGETGTMPYSGILCGGKGSVRNCFAVGELMRTIWNSDNVKEVEPYLEYGPAVNGGVSNSSTDIENNYFFSSYPSAYTFKCNIKGRQERATDTMLLRDPSFYERTVNRTDAFRMEDVGDGFFPRIQMSDEMMKQQYRIPLSSVGVDNSIKFLSAVIDKQYERGDLMEDKTAAAEDFALATLTFTNPLERTISSIRVDGLYVEPQSGSAFEQYMDNGLYRVKVKLRPNNIYSDSYAMTQFSYDTYTSDVVGREIVVAFSKEVNQENWCTAFDNPNSQYRLTGDIDYAKFLPTEKKKAAEAMNFSSAFKGSLDGRGHSLKNFTFTQYPYLIPRMEGGTIKDLVVEGMTIDNSSANSSYAGLVGQTTGNTKFKDIVLKNSEIRGIYQMAGGLVGRATRAVMENCVVAGLVMESDTDGRNMRVGGLAGDLSYTRIQNCLVRKLEMDIRDGQTAEGIGGIAGYVPYGSTIRSCYAQGSIDTGFSRTGGLAGYLNGTVLSSWSKVNISATAPYVGGATGIMDTSSTLNQILVIGEVFTTASDGYGRINGGFLGNGRTLVRCYASANQKINSQTLNDVMDANGLMTDEELKLERYYWNTVNIGEAFDYSHVEEGYLPYLYNIEGTGLLPEQDYENGISISTGGIEFTAKGIAEGIEDGTEGRETFQYRLSMELRLTYEDLKDQASYDKNYSRYFGANYERLSIENMQFAKENGQIRKPTVAFSNGTCILTFTGITAEKYLDSYRVVLNTEDGKVGMKLDFFEKKEGGIQAEPTPLYYHIYRAEQNPALVTGDVDLNSWQGAMAVAGDQYENFLIMKNLDFTGIPSSDLRTGLKINRLEGNLNHVDYSGLNEARRREYLLKTPGEDDTYAAIANVTFKEEKTANVSWIYELRSEMQYLKFQNISWTNGYEKDGSYIGIVRLQTGTVSYVDVVNLQIDYGNATSYIGFVTNMNNSMEYVRGRDIVIRSSKTANAKRTASYIGGIVATSRGAMEHISAVGTEKNGVWTYSIVGNTNPDGGYGNYTGGIVGYAEEPGLKFGYAETVQVKGNAYVGPVGGRIYAYASQCRDYTTAMYQAIQVEGEDKIYFNSAVGCDVEGRTYVGGVMGYSYTRYGYSKDNTVHATSEQAGGYCGNGGGDYMTVTGCNITADGMYAGGISPNTGHGCSYSAVTGCNIRAGSCAGGLAGRSTVSTGAVIIRDCAIFAEEYAGGLYGMKDAETGNHYAYNVIVTDCKIGRTTTEYPEAEKDPDNPDGYVVQWKTDSGRGTKFAGGLVGESHGTRYYNSIVDDSVEVKAAQYGGGGFGRFGGGESHDLHIGTTVKVDGNYAGGLAGELIGYDQSLRGPNLLLYPVTKVQRMILSGSVEGNAGVGGLAGYFTPGERPVDPEDGTEISDEVSGYRDMLHKDYFERIILAQTSVTSSTGSMGILAQNDKAVQTSGDGGVAYLRVYENLMYGTRSGAQPIRNQPGVLGAFPTWTYEDPNTPESQYREAYLVTTDNLKNLDFYYGTKAKGGLYIKENTTSYWNAKDKVLANTNYFRNFYYSADVTDKGLFPYVTNSGSYVLVGAWLEEASPVQDGIPIPEVTSGISTLSLGDLSESLDQVSIYASGAGTVNLEFPADVADLGADVIEVRELAKTEPEILEGMILPKVQFEILGSDGTLIEQKEIVRQTYTIPYDFTSTLTIRVTLGENSRSFAVTGDGVRHTVMTWGDHCYYIRKDGIYRDNGAYVGDSRAGEAGLGSGDGAGTGSGVNFGGGAAGAGSDSGTNSGGSMANVRKVLSGSFVNLYQGEALDSDGTLYRVTGRDASGRGAAGQGAAGVLEPETLFKVSEETVPAYRTDYSGEEILSYRTYSMTDHGGTRSDYRLFAKNGKLFGMDPQLDQPYGQGFQSFLADYYSTSQGSAEYLSIVTENRVLEDRKTAIRWPKDENQRDILDNFQILEIGDTLYADEPYVIIRYCDNTTAAFNYLTGTLLFKDDSEKEALGFADYASLWASGKKVALKTMNAYNSAAGLVDSLMKNPIDDNQVIGFIKKTDAPENPADGSGNKLDVAIDGDNKVGGSNSIGGTGTSGGSGGSDQGAEKDGALTENTAEGPESGADKGSQNGEAGKPSDGKEGVADADGVKTDGNEGEAGEGGESGKVSAGEKDAAGDGDKSGESGKVSDGEEDAAGEGGESGKVSDGEKDAAGDSGESGKVPDGEKTDGNEDAAGANGEKADADETNADKTGTGTGQGQDADKTGNENDRAGDANGAEDGVGTKSKDEESVAGQNNSDGVTGENAGGGDGTESGKTGNDRDAAGAGSGKSGDGQNVGKTGDGRDADGTGMESGSGKAGDGQTADGTGTESESGKAGDGQTADGTGTESESGKAGDGQTADGTGTESGSEGIGAGQNADSRNQTAGSGTDRSERAEASGRSDRAEGAARADGPALISNLDNKDAGAAEVNTAGGVTGEKTVDSAKNVGDAAGSSESQTEPGEAKAALPSLTSDRAYVTMLTADAGGYEVFRAEDLLTMGGESLISENRKMEIMEENGIRQNAINLEAMKVSAETNRTGLVLVGAAAACMVVLLGVLYDKKKRMSRQE